MTIDLGKPDLIVAVIGAGAMGRGIAQVCAQAGIATLLFDARDGAVAEAIAAVGKGLDSQVAKGRMTAEDKAGVMARLKPIGTIEEVAPAGLAIEAIVLDTIHRHCPVWIGTGRRGAGRVLADRMADVSAVIRTETFTRFGGVS